MNDRIYTNCDTLLGEIYIVAERNLIAALHIGEDDFLHNEDAENIKYEPENALLREANKQMCEYFQGTRQYFDLPLVLEGTDFRLSVWNELAKIPYGVTRSYQSIAEAIGNPKAVRAIGQANKANKLPIIIPCHRVIGKNMTLTGYAGKRIDIKEKLLSIERAQFIK